MIYKITQAGNVVLEASSYVDAIMRASILMADDDPDIGIIINGRTIDGAALAKTVKMFEALTQQKWTRHSPDTYDPMYGELLFRDRFRDSMVCELWKRQLGDNMHECREIRAYTEALPNDNRIRNRIIIHLVRQTIYAE